mgnify:CR=1 FL=1
MNNKKPNEYALLNFKRDSEPDGTLRFQSVVFYEMKKDGSFDNGTTLEEMLRVSIERLADLNGRFACKENIEALSHLKDALNYLNMRTADREARGVEGKHQE